MTDAETISGLRALLAERDAEIERLRARVRHADARRLGEVLGDWSQFVPGHGGPYEVQIIDLRPTEGWSEGKPKGDE